MKRIISIISIACLLAFSNSPLFSLPARAATCDNLVSWWSLDESSDGSGAVARADSVVASANDLTDVNTTPSATGKVSLGANLEKDNGEHFTAADDDTLDITGDISLSFWFNPESINIDHIVLNKEAYPTERGYAFKFTTANKLLFWASAASGGTESSWRTTDAVIAAGNWYHFVVTVDISVPSAVMYVNGSSVSLTTIDTSVTAIVANAASLGIGNIAGGAVYSDGIFDEMALWSRVLTSDEVTTLYNSGNGVNYATACGGGAPAGGTKKRVPPIIFE